jgi:hypothetical protein
VHIQVLKVADTAVDHLQRVRRGRGPEVSPLDQGGGEASLGGIPGSSGSADATTNYEHVEFNARQF